MELTFICIYLLKSLLLKIQDDSLLTYHIWTTIQVCFFFLCWLVLFLLPRGHKVVADGSVGLGSSAFGFSFGLVRECYLFGLLLDFLCLCLD